MTLEELEQLEINVKEKMQSEYIESKEKGYTRGFDFDKYWMSMSEEIIDFLYVETFEELLNVVEEAKIEIEKFKDFPGFYTDTEKSADEYGIEEFRMKIYYKELINEEMLQKRIKQKIKEEIRIKLKPASEQYSRDIDCKLLQLFRDGVITWEALQKLVYSDCEI